MKSICFLHNFFIYTPFRETAGGLSAVFHGIKAGMKFRITFHEKKIPAQIIQNCDFLGSSFFFVRNCR